MSWLLYLATLTNHHNNIMAYLLKARIMEPEETSIAREQHSNKT
jgi:hypothetical protein